ncbi:MAG TPA: P-loop NTPase [Thermoanaerobaculaceae bacterium]|nr:P-loop NTPase [Thermoanaerobaculaceae bacterium]HPS76945.1 P-loop NTPase [Thermoanaerobaculaceae bacterium]
MSSQREPGLAGAGASAARTDGTSPRQAITGDRATTPARLVAIGGGKGGIGKSAIATTLAVEMARRGLRTTLVDCDFGGPNLHSLLAMSQPRASLSDYLARRVGSLAELALTTPVPGLSLIAGPGGAGQESTLLHQQRTRLIRALSTLEADVIVLDLGAGAHYNVVDFFLLATHGILVVTPEPTSVENAYRFLKVAFLRRVKSSGLAEEFRNAALGGADGSGALPRTPAALVAEIARLAPATGEALSRLLASFRPELVVNQVRSAQDLALGEAMSQVSSRLFGLKLQLLGHAHHCELLARAIRSRLPVVPENLGREFTADIAGLASRLLARQQVERRP